MEKTEIISMLNGFLELDDITLREVISRTIHKSTGGIKPDVEGGCDPKTCSGNSGCTPTTKNGDCECTFSGTCAWIPLLG